MTQDELLLELDCSAPDVDPFLYDADPITGSRLSLGTLIDLVASALAISATSKTVAFEMQIEALPPSPLASLRLRLKHANGHFEVDHSSAPEPSSYQPSAFGQRVAPGLWLERAAEWSQVEQVDAQTRAAIDSALPDTLGTLLRVASDHSGISWQFELTPSVRDACAGFSVHPMLLTSLMHTAAQLVPGPLPQRQTISFIERVTVLSPGALPVRALVVKVDDSASGSRIDAALFDETDHVIACFHGIVFGPHGGHVRTHAALSKARLMTLAVESLGRDVPFDANLLRLDLSSLDLVRLVTAVQSETRVRLSIEAFLTQPTLQHLYELTVRGVETSGVDLSDQLERIVSAQPRPDTGLYPLTSAQLSFWLASLKPHAAPAYVESAAWHVRGELDRVALSRAWFALSSRYESLRTAFVEHAGTFQQRVLSALEVIECRESPDVERWLPQQLALTFAADERLARLELLRVQPDQHVLLLLAHHAICDGGSLAERVIPELAALYSQALQNREASDSPPSAQPRHLAAWEKDPACAAQLAGEAARWAGQLAGEVDELPTDHVRPAQLTYRGKRHTLELSPELNVQLAGFTRRTGHSRFTVTLAAFSALLYRYSGQRDQRVGVPVAQRFSPSLVHAAGCLINFAPLPSRLDGQTSMAALLDHVSGEVAHLLSRQHLPFALVNARLSNSSETCVGFSHEAVWPALELTGLHSERLPIDLTHAKLEFFLRLESSANSLRAIFEYSAELYDEETIVTLARHYERILRALVDAPETRARELPWLNAAEHSAALDAAKGPSLAGAQLLSTLLTRHARTDAESIAVTDGTRELTYAALDKRASALARTLTAAGVARGDLVVLYLEASVDWPVAVFATWKAGAGIVPIDAEQPHLRQAHMFEVAQAKVAIADEQHRSALAKFGVRTIPLDSEVAQFDHARADLADLELLPDDVAYGIFTSGSTGVPKLAMATHGGLANKALAQREIFRLAAGTRVLQLASPAFDAALSELMLSVSAGGTLFVPPRAARYSGDALASLLQREQIAVAMLTPSVLATLPNVELPLTLLLVIGERCSAELVDRWAIGRDMYNLYGPTEATIWATSEHCQPGQGDPTIGKAIPNTRVYVLDDDLNLLGPGEAGEICIGGAGVGPGYRHASPLDDARFVLDPFAQDSSQRLYRTGDRGRYSHDGRVVFLGRNDDQVKLSGRRIELGEIEHALRRLSGVEEAVVVVHARETSNARLSAFVQTRSADITSTALREQLRVHLPVHMLPSSLAIVEHWPRLISGKVDRRALAARPLLRDAAAALTTASERQVAEAFAQILGIDVESIGRHDDFFALGGRSLDVVRLAERLAQVGILVAVAELLQGANVSQLASYADLLDDTSG